MSNIDSSRFFHRETVINSARGEAKVIRHSSKQDEYAHVVVSVQPSARGAGAALAWNAGSNIPARFVGAVSEGVQEAIEHQSGYEVTDIQIVVESGSYHDVDSTEAAFREAAEKAMASALQRATLKKLEAVVSAAVTVPEEFAGTIMEIIHAHDGQGLRLDSHEGSTSVAGQVAAGSLYGLIKDALTATQGRASISYHIAGYHRGERPPEAPEEWAGVT